MNSSGRKRALKVILNVYDLAPMNQYTYEFGFGVFHSGVEIAGKEFSFGGHQYSSSGLFTVEPKNAAGAIFREAIEMGETTKSSQEVQAIVDSMASEFYGNTYHLVNKNCNHFSDALCKTLLGKGIPGFVNRMATVGAFVPCLLPQNLGVQTPTNNLITSSSSTTETSFSAFSGEGKTLSEQQQHVAPSEVVLMDSEQTNITSRRERLLAAATRRLGSSESSQNL